MSTKLQRRRAIVIHRKTGEAQDCHVLGIFQVSRDNVTQPYFICEMITGKCIYVEPTRVKFVDIDENGEII